MLIARGVLGLIMKVFIRGATRVTFRGSNHNARSLKALVKKLQ